LGATLTAIPGSSRAFSGGVIAYSNSVKSHVLGVREATLAGEGAVSRECVLEMSSAAARLFGVEVGVAISGVAGPGGGSQEKPVGTVWIAVALGDRTFAFHHLFPGERAQVRDASVGAALEHLVEKLELA
jgi:nicotinamide-nucleotide amidase